MSGNKLNWFSKFLTIGLVLVGIGFVIKWFFNFIFSIPLYIWFWGILLFLIIFYSN
jgi:hypothetical protein